MVGPFDSGTNMAQLLLIPLLVTTDYVNWVLGHGGGKNTMDDVGWVLVQ